jgi:sugar (pentulose or hexulose) kinase
MPLVLGIDSSTQSCTVELRDALDGTPAAGAASPHPPTTPPVSEQHPAAWWSALRLAVADALAECSADARDVVAVSVDAQGHGLVGLDGCGRVIRPAKLWNDTTCAPQARELVERLGADQWAERTGSVPVSAFTISKLAWLAAHEPRNFARLRTILTPHDWLTWRLCGKKVTERSDASGTGYFNPRTNAWDTGLLDLIDDLPDWKSLLPEVRGPNEPAGRLTAKAAADLGLHAGIVVAPGTGDQQKVLFARAVLQNSRLLLLDEPTKGVDIGAKAEIHALVRALAADTGAAVIVVSTEEEELIGLADAVCVFKDGSCDGTKYPQGSVTAGDLRRLAWPDSEHHGAHTDGAAA